MMDVTPSFETVTCLKRRICSIYANFDTHYEIERYSTEKGLY